MYQFLWMMEQRIINLMAKIPQMWSGTGAHVFHPYTWDTKDDLCESEARLLEYQATQGCIVRPYLKQQQNKQTKPPHHPTALEVRI